jgi:hypothetical protein
VTGNGQSRSTSAKCRVQDDGKSRSAFTTPIFINRSTSRCRLARAPFSYLEHVIIITRSSAERAHLNMDLVPIAELHPELSARDSRQFKAAVTLIWPYSSSQREFALLLAEPEFRLRRKKGQVRARFSGSSARALATTGVGIGDEVVLSLRGAQFIQDGSVSTPGKSIDWELEYTQSVVVQVFRDGTEIANLELLDAAPTPAPRSPVRRQTTIVASPAQQWSSPAFLKRARLSDGPIFQAPYDPLADENADGHDKKRRRKSYRDWKAWTYSARTPSPDKGDASTEDDFESMDVSPSRQTQLPDTPVSPSRNGMLSVATRTLEGAADAVDQGANMATAAVPQITNVEEAVGGKVPRPPETDDFVRDDDYYDLYAGPDEDRLANAQYAFGGDTEANTEEEGLEDTDAVSMSPTEVDTTDLEEGDQEHQIQPVDDPSKTNALAIPEADTGSTTEEGNLVELPDVRESIASGKLEYLEKVEETPLPVMPPPTLPFLDTSFQAPVPRVLTPIGKEPASPTLQPLDSALLPLPSPFPGGSDQNITSYLDHVSSIEQPLEPEVEEQEPPSEASYIMENSFFSSIGSSKTNPVHPNHESAFTPVRFTFGMDGAGLSRPLELSSPVPEDPIKEAAEAGTSEAVSRDEVNVDAEPDIHESTVEQKVVKSYDASVSSPLAENGASVTKEHDSEDTNELEDLPAASSSPKYTKSEPEVIELSSDSEEDSQESEMEDHIPTEDVMAVDHNEDNTLGSSTEGEEVENHTSNDQRLPQDYLGTDQSATPPRIVELGSPSGGSDIQEPISEVQVPNVDEDKASEAIEGASSTAQVQSLLSDDPPVEAEQIESHSEFIAVEYAPAFSDTAASTQERPVTHTSTQEEMQIAMEHNMDSQSLVVDELEFLPAMHNQDTLMEDNLLQEHPFDVAQWQQDLEEHHPDIKLESIEADSMFQVDEQGPQQEQGLHDGSHLAGEILLEVPEEGHKLGEFHTVSVPATAPSRNTRSKAKTSASPTKEGFPSPKRATRSTRSKASATSVARTTMSPSQEAHQTSPYSLRSQSKLLSPTKSIPVTTARRSPRKHASQQSIDSISDVGSSRLHNLDPFLTSFMPSQELGASQKSRYSEASVVKDSEEESLRSEHSISTVKYSDDWNTFTNFSDPLLEHEHNQDAANSKSFPSTAPELGARVGKDDKEKKGEPEVVGNSPSPVDPSLVTQAAPSSPHRRLRSASGTEVASSSPRILRTTRQNARNISPSPKPTEKLVDDTPPKSKALVYPELPGEGESNEPKYSPVASAEVDEDKRSSPTAAATTLPLNQQSLADRKTLLTPDATQQTNIEAQNSMLDGQQQQILPLTPQLTQGTSAGLRSFVDPMSVEATSAEPDITSSPTLVTKSTPRRNATQSDVASPSTTPKEYSPDVSSDVDATSVEKPEGPSIGLSTPLAYYTPLNSLTYFLNRSSQFHTSSNPDVLALVTSSSTPPQRATKGRKDWTTTLHITDASTWPATTTVNIFRPYQPALPTADAGDIILLRAFAVKSLNRHPTLTSADESSWCVWRYNKPVWGAKRGAFSEVRAREETKGPLVERGEGEWREVEKLRTWWVEKVKAEVEGKIRTRSRDKGKEKEKEGDHGVEEKESGVVTRSKDRKKGEET